MSGQAWAKRPSLLEIDSVLQEKLQPQIDFLNKERKKAQVLLVAAFPCLFALFLTYSSWAGPVIEKGLPAPLLFLTLIAAIAVCGYAFATALKTFRSCFKEKVMAGIVEHFYPQLRYFPYEFVDKDFYDESGLFRESLDTYKGGDLFRGKTGEVEFQFSELCCSYETGSGKSRRTVTVFKGFFFVGDFQRPLHFRTYIQPDNAEKWLGVLGRGLQRMESGSRLVDLENPEFEKEFVVTSDDQVEARYIVTPVFMEKLLDFRRRAGCDLHLAFLNGKMMLAVATGKDYFEPHLFGNILSRRDLMDFIDMLNLLTGVTEEFLNYPKLKSEKER